MRFIALVGLCLMSYVSGQTYETIPRGILPYTLREHSVAYDGNNAIYTFGGWDGTFVPSKNILKYDLVSEEVSIVGEFPLSISDAAIGSGVNGSVYLLGGKETYTWGDSGYQTTIYRIDLGDDTIEPVPVAALPYAVSQSAYASDDAGNIYLLGGLTLVGYRLSILKYSIALNTVEIVGQLPWAVTEAAATWANGTVYVFGGVPNDEPLSTIFKYEASTGTVTEVGTMPHTGYSSAVVVGTDIYIVGGLAEPAKLFLYRFDTITETVVELEVTHSEYRIFNAGVVYVESLKRIYIIGNNSIPGEAIYSIQL